VINQRVGRIIRLFRWGGSEELVPAAIYVALKTVAGLRRGRSPARETEPVRPVPDAFVEAIRPHVAAQVWAMVGLQRLTGMRPGEVCAIRAADLDMTGPVWAYRPAAHKMMHRDRERLIHLGPRSQEILRPWLRTDPGEHLFQPCEANAARRAEMRRVRQTKVPPSQRDRSRPDARRRPATRYSPASFRNAIYRACQAAGVPRWGPNRIRHNVATELRARFGVDLASVILGHANPSTTLIYAQADQRRAAEAMLRIG
jgi:integrase